MLFAEINTNWKNKRTADLFRNTIAQYWKGVAVITSEIQLNWNKIYKPRGTAFRSDNSV